MPKRGPPKDYALFAGVSFRAPAAGAAGGEAAAADPAAPAPSAPSAAAPAPPAPSIRSELSGALLRRDPTVAPTLQGVPRS